MAAFLGPGTSLTGVLLKLHALFEAESHERWLRRIYKHHLAELVSQRRGGQRLSSAGIALLNGELLDEW